MQTKIETAGVRMSRRHVLTMVAGTAALTRWHGTHAQNPAPPSTIRLTVGYPAGGPVDACARLIAPALNKTLGTQVIVENLPGAGGSVAGSAVAKAVPDGSTLLLAASAAITISPHVQKAMPFDPLKDLTPVAPVVEYANLLVVNKNLPIHNIQDLIRYARSHSVSYGSSGPGASNHLAGELFQKMSGAPMLHVPYKGGAPAMVDVMAGTVSMMFDVVATAQPFAASGRVRALAVTTRKRVAQLPDVPTMMESGLPDYDVGGWFAIYGPAAMPSALVTRLNNAIRSVLAQPDIANKLRTQGYDLWTGSPVDIAERATKESQLWASVAKDLQLK